MSEITPAANPGNESSAEIQMRRLTRRAFATGGFAAVAALGGWKWLQSRPHADGIPWPFRRVLDFNERVGRALFSPEHLAPEFDPRLAGEPRVNGWIGYMPGLPGREGWRVRVEAPTGDRQFSLADLASLPRTEMITELKCVEGWSQVVRWGGWRFADFLREFRLLPPADSPFQYLHLSTTGGGYTVALDLPSALHPQTLLCDSMNGEPLTAGHGAPLRLVLPVKYGIKNIKWLANIRLLDTRPTDYWTTRGYDWYAGL